MDENEISKLIVGSAIEVRSALGPGLLESVYEAALARELVLKGASVETQVPVVVAYKGVNLGIGYRLDLLVNGLVVVGVKAVDRLIPIHEAQLLSYLRLTGKKLGLLLIFNERLMRQGIHRLVNGL